MDQTLAEVLDVPFSQRTPEYERYVVKGELGEGGMGRVYRAHDSKLNRDVAIKVMTIDEGSDDADLDDLRARFYREAKIVATMHHPNVLQMLDFSGSDAPVPFIVTELLDGVDLDSLIDCGPMPEKVVAAIGYFLAQGLGHAHGLHIVHRDVKPKNVFIEHDGRVVLIDFGVAKGVRATNTRVTLMASRTRVVGTTLFSSPEQVRTTAPPGPPSDLFSLGSLLYFSLTQVLPFSGKTVREILEKLVNEPPLDLRRLVSCSDGMAQLIGQLLQKAPEARPPNDQVVAALKELAGDARFATLQESIAAYVRAFETGASPMEHVHDTSVGPPMDTQRETSLAESQWPVSGPQTPPTPLPDTAPPRALFDTVTALKPEPGALRTKTKGKEPRRGVIWVLGVLGFCTIAASAVMLALQPSSLPLAKAPQAVASSPPPVTAGTAKLRVLVKPWGKVSIDGVERGTTPAFRVVELSLGRHVVFVTNPAFGTREVAIVLPEPNREETIVVDFTAPQ
jgi:serine/threonine protein kinase